MENSYSYKSNNIDNVRVGDFCLWYADKNQWNDRSYTYIKEAIQLIDAYFVFAFNNYYNPVDSFKDLDMRIKPVHKILLSIMFHIKKKTIQKKFL